MITFRLSLRVKPLGNGGRRHWSVSAKERKLAKLATMASAPPHPFTVERVTLTRLIGPRGRKYDEGDNLRSSLKAVRDGVSDGLRFRDDEKLTWEYAQEKSTSFGVRVVIFTGEGV